MIGITCVLLLCSGMGLLGSFEETEQEMDIEVRTWTYETELAISERLHILLYLCSNYVTELLSSITSSISTTPVCSTAQLSFRVFYADWHGSHMSLY
jgi:hypothetical protein